MVATRRIDDKNARTPHKTLTALAVLAPIDPEIRRQRDDLDEALRSVRVIARRRERMLRRYLGDDHAAISASTDGEPGDAIAAALMRRCGRSDGALDLRALADALRAIAMVDTELAEAMIRCHDRWTRANAYLDRCAEASRAAIRTKD